MLPPSIHNEPEFVILSEAKDLKKYTKRIGNEILRLTAQNDKRAIRESPLQPVGNGLDRSVKLYQITRANTVRPYE